MGHDFKKAALKTVNWFDTEEGRKYLHERGAIRPAQQQQEGQWQRNWQVIEYVQPQVT